MAHYRIFGIGPSLADSSAPEEGFVDFIYGVATEFGIQNDDGTRTYVTGTGFTYDWTNLGAVTAGTVTAISHYDASGKLLDTVSGLELAATTLAFSSGGNVYKLTIDAAFPRDDVINARVRAGGAIVNDVINGYAGNDKIYSGAGDDYIDAGNGNDYIHASTGNDHLVGGAGADRLMSYAGNDIIIGDTLEYYQPDAAADIMYGGRGKDVLLGGGGNDFIDGGDGIDTAAYLSLFSELTVSLAQGGLQVSSTAGVDSLYGVERIAALDGIYAWKADGSGYEKILDTTSIELLASAPTSYLGTNGDDSLQVYSSGAKSLYQLGEGNDTITFYTGSYGATFIDGGAGNDNIGIGSYPSPTFGTFIVHGGSGNDVIGGSYLANLLFGDSGNDQINGGGGNDTMSGGKGSDTFLFTTSYSDTHQGYVNYNLPGNDVITDFVVGTDKLDIAGTVSSVVDTAEGILVTASYLASVNSQFGQYRYGNATILLQGVHGNFDAADLLV